MINVIKFSERKDDQAKPFYRGKNGVSPIRGLEVMTTSINAVMLTPMNSRGISDSCIIEIPGEHLLEVIYQLQSAYNSLNPH